MLLDFEYVVACTLAGFCNRKRAAGESERTHSGAKGTKEEGFFPHKRVERKEEKTTQLGRKKKRRRKGEREGNLLYCVSTWCDSILSCRGYAEIRGTTVCVCDVVWEIRGDTEGVCEKK